MGGLIGIWAGGWLGDRFGQMRKSRFITIPGIAFIATVPFYIIAIMSDNMLLTFSVLVIPLIKDSKQLGLLSLASHKEYAFGRHQASRLL